VPPLAKGAEPPLTATLMVLPDSDEGAVPFWLLLLLLLLLLLSWLVVGDLSPGQPVSRRSETKHVVSANDFLFFITDCDFLLRWMLFLKQLQYAPEKPGRNRVLHLSMRESWPTRACGVFGPKI
jgi:hypothetical protein